MATFWESEDAVRAFAGDDIRVAKYYDFDKSFCSNWSRLHRITKRMIGNFRKEHTASAMFLYTFVLRHWPF
jgi:hypothetical protein